MASPRIVSHLRPLGGCLICNHAAQKRLGPAKGRGTRVPADLINRARLPQALALIAMVAVASASAVATKGGCGQARLPRAPLELHARRALAFS